MVSDRRLPLLCRWALGASMVAGGLHVLIAAVRRFWLDEFIWVSRDFVWMVPLGYGLTFLGTAGLVGTVLAFFSSVVFERTVRFVFATLATFGVLLLFPRLHPLASLVVAVGVGVRLATWRRASEPQGWRWLPRWALGVGVVLGLWAAVREMQFRRAEAKAVASLPAPPADAPNVLLLILDTVRAASMSFMGYARETTPSLASLANDGRVFDEAYSTAPWTLPSHAGIFTARYPSSLSTDWKTPLDASDRTIAEVFAEQGYVTAGFAANHFYTSWESGLTRGFVHYEDYRRTLKQVLLSTTFFQTNLFWSVVHDMRPTNIARQLLHLDLRTQTMWTSDRKTADQTVSQLLRWELARRGRPFFAFVNLYDAHLPYDPPAPWPTRFSSTPTPIDRYDGAIAYMDHAIGQLVDSLRQRGVLDRTVVIVTSDHGEGFGEHGLHGHGNSLYRPELHVPLIIRYPTMVPPGRVNAPVTLRDLAATACELTGRSCAGLAGTSLSRTWGHGSGAGAGSPVLSEVSAGVNTEPGAPVSRGAMRSLVDNDWHYIRNGDAVEELYALGSDSGELRNLAPTDTVTVSTLRARARQALATALPR